MRRGTLISLLLLAAACSGERGEPEVLATVEGDPGRGEVLIERYGCGSCHVIPGVRQARGKVGPPLTDFAERTYIAGNLTNTSRNLVSWIRYPDSVEPGTVMPTLGVSDQEARDISAYLLLETSTGGFGPPRLLPPSLIHGD
jgi:cytochrome c1